MKYIIVYLLLLFSRFGISQTVIDSNEIESIIDSSLNMARNGENPDKAMIVLNVGLQLLELSPKKYLRLCIKGLYVKGRIYEIQEKYKSEFKILDSAILLSKKHNLDNGYIYARILVHFANSCLKDNNYQLAYDPLITSKRIFKSLNDKDNDLLVSSYLIDYYYYSNQFEDGDKLIHSVENNLDSTFSINFIKYFYSKVAEFYWKLNIFDKANYYSDSLINLDPNDDKNKCTLIINRLHYSMNAPFTIDKLNKFQLLIQSLECSNALFSSSPIEYAGVLNQLVEVILRTGIADISFADSLLNIESQKLRIDTIDLKNIVHDNTFNNIITYYNLVGLSILKKSDTTLTQSSLYSLKKLVNQVEIITEDFTDFKIIPENHINSFLLLASQYFYHSKDPKLNKILNLYRQKVSQSISKAVNFMTESELSQFIQNEIFSKTDIFFELYDPNIMTDDYTSFLFQLALQTKGLLMRKSTELNKFIAESKDSSIVSLFSKLSALELQIKNSPDQKSILFKQKETYERECLRLLRSTHKEDSFNISLLKEKLNKDEIAVEFIKYKSSFRKNSPEKYMALVLDSERIYPVVIPLFEESQLLNSNANSNLSKTTENELAANSNARGTGLKPIKDNNHSHHYKLIWEPILRTFPETKLINFSSVGILNTLNLSSLSIKKNETMIDKYKLRQFTNTYNYTTISVKQPKVFDKVLLVGGLEYGETSQSSKIEDQLHWNYLPGTLTETKSIHELMKKKNLNPTLISGLQAREEIVTGHLKESYDIIHIATHGFYLNTPIPSNNRYHFNSNPLFNSMLVLSDANSIAKKDIFTKNGYINAYEISRLDLSKTNLVVLSACETGVGLNTNRFESTFSLVRGLKIAGVENIVASLWPVSDRSTIQFMTKLYSNLIQTNNTVSEAFQITQQQMKTKHPDDSTWSAFILIN